MTDKIYRDREILTAAQAKGTGATLGAYFRLSGPGWLQSAITLGGGSLGGALYLGMLGGTSMLWLEIVAIVIGVIMLSAIAYVTLSTGKRPYVAINEYVNPVLGVGWITATILANMIWIMPQFSLCYDALDTNLVPNGLGDTIRTKTLVSLGLGVLAMGIVIMSFNPGWMSRLFDWVLKIIVAIVVICFVLVVYRLATDGSLDWNAIAMGFIPNFNHWNTAAPDIQEILNTMPGDARSYWNDLIIEKQRSSMVGVTATAVGLNMTFLLPYSMLARGWDKPFRGLARFDLVTAMAIPFIIVTSCIVIASAHAFHAKADAELLSNDPAVVQTSKLFGSVSSVFESRYEHDLGATALATLNQRVTENTTALARAQESNDQESIKIAEAELAAARKEKASALAVYIAGLSESEKRIAPTLVKPNTNQLALALEPLLGSKNANLVFGLGAFAMGFSTIIILMLINAYAFSEIAGRPSDTLARTVGAVAAVAAGVCWFLVWKDESKTWLIIVASTFAAILLPIAYISFFALMNSRRLLGDEKPVGMRMTVWNLLMAIGVLGAIAQAIGAIQTRLSDPKAAYILGGVATYLLLALIGFSARFRRGPTQT